MNPTVIHGFTRGALARRFAALGFVRGAEIGVRQGAFSELLCQTIPGLELLCVDPWRYYQSNPKQPSQDRQDANYRVAQDRLRPFRATLVKATSLEAVDAIPTGTLDFVYIDGNHQYDYVRADLAAWSPRVRGGGVVSGDDYDAPGVRQAVHEFVEAHGIHEWWLTDDPGRRNRKGDTFRSWFWVQP